MKARFLGRGCAIALVALCTSSCMTWTPGYQQSLTQKTKADAVALIHRAEDLEQHADTAGKVQDLIQAYQAVCESSPNDFQALWKTGHYHLLYGAAYTETREEKQSRYILAAQYFERAMATNPQFNAAVQQGKSTWECSELLGKKEIPAIGYWSMAVFYNFGECLSKTGRLVNTRWISRIGPMMDRVDQLDPTWEGGAMDFSRAVYYIALPEKFGGDKKKAEQLFARAIEKGPDYLVNRWGRAKYLYSLTGQREEYLADLQWVIAQDPHTGSNPYPWNVYFQRDAKKMLAESDGMFKK